MSAALSSVSSAPKTAASRQRRPSQPARARSHRHLSAQRALAPFRLTDDAFKATRSTGRRSGAAVRRVDALFSRGGGDEYDIADDGDGVALKVDISMKDVSKGKKIGQGSFGDVFEGKYKGQGVVLKERKLTGNGRKFFETEAALNRRLKGAKGVAPFLGVAGANAYLVWRDEGRVTLDAVLNGRGGSLTSAMGIGDEAKAVKVFSKQLLQAVNSVHGQGVVHRDVKPDNILFAQPGGGGPFGGKPSIKLIDLGAAADLRTGTNYSPDETVFDPVYGPPEKYLDVKGVGSLFGLGAAAGWAQSKPDLFDAFSCGMVILQVSCPSLRKGKAMGGVKRDLNIYAYDAEAWRDSLPERRQADFAILDADGGKGWDLVCGLLSQRKKRTSVSKAIGHPFLR